MPEHGTLQKDFRKAKYEFPLQTLCLLDSLSPIGKVENTRITVSGLGDASCDSYFAQCL